MPRTSHNSLLIAAALALSGGQAYAASSPKPADGVTFESRGEIAIKKSSLVACSEGAASAEDLEVALAACDAAVAERPDSGDAQYYRGFVLFHLERYADAQEAFSAAIDLNASRLAESYYQRGVCKERQRALRDAAADFKSASDLKPEWSAARRKVEEYRWAFE